VAQFVAARTEPSGDDQVKVGFDSYHVNRIMLRIIIHREVVKDGDLA
jgi:hypothetical protein